MISRFLGVIFFFALNPIQAQTPTQTIRGKVIDQITETPMIGATITVLGTDPLMGATTDMGGDFKITGVPVGTYSLRISYMGYREIILPQVAVNSGKEVVLTVAIEEDIRQIQEFVVTADRKSVV